MNRRLVIVSIAVLTIVGTGWAFVNPRGRFGVCQYGVTTYSLLPLAFLDLQVGGDGTTRWVRKTHDIDGKRLTWLLRSKPDVLIVALGWRSAARLAPSLSAPSGTKVIALPTEEALALFNKLADQHVRVAIHVHSTC